MKQCVVAPADDPTPGPTPEAAAAFERLTLQYLGDVARVARALTADAARAHGLVEATYRQALRGWATRRPGADPRRWLLTVCHQVFMRGVPRDVSDLAAPDADPELESLATAVAHGRAQRAGTAEAAERLDLRPALARALDALPASYRAAVALVDVAGEDYEAASAVLGVPVRTVRARLFRGRRLLQDQLFADVQELRLAARHGVGTP